MHSPSSSDRAAVATHFTRIASVYDRYWSAALLPASRQLVQLLRLRSSRAVLDVGAGVGSLHATLAAAAPAARILLTDRAAGMLARAPADADRIVADADHLPLRDGMIDVAVLAFMLQYLDDPTRTLREVRRVLRSGGHVGVLVWGITAESAAEHLWLAALDDAGAPEGTKLATYNDAVDTPDKLRDILSAAGYAHIDVHFLPWSDQPDLDTFIHRQQVLGASGRRFAVWDAQHRTTFLARMRTQLALLEPDAFLNQSEVLAVIAHE
jgi:malonyl-CoA O-methyltransferase